MKNFVDGLKTLDCGILFLAHEETKTIKIGGLEVHRRQPAVSGRVWEQIMPITEMVVCMEMIPMLVQKKRKEVRVLRTQPLQELYCKDRTGVTLKAQGDKDYLVADAQAFVKLFD